MISLLTSVAMAFIQGPMPVQFVPKSQFPFERKDTVLESGVGEATATILVNDENVSNEVLEAVNRTPESIRIVELVKKDASGRLVFWAPSGKAINDNMIEIPNAEQAKMEPGDVHLIIDSSAAVGFPKTAKDKPVIGLNITAVKQVRQLPVTTGKIYGLYKIGAPKFKFSNIRLSVSTRVFAGEFPTTSGASTVISEVGFKVVGQTDSLTDKLEHFQVLQSGFAGMDNYALYGSYDWSAVERELGPVRNKNEFVGGRVLRKEGAPIDPKEMYIDFPSRRPVKYLSTITVVRASGIQGFFQHIATEPIG